MKEVEHQIVSLEKDLISFVLFNPGGEDWEWCLQKHNGLEHSIKDMAAVGLVFKKSFASNMARVLRRIADRLDTNNNP